MSYVHAATALIPRKAAPPEPKFQQSRVAASKPGLKAKIIQFLLAHPYQIYAFLRRYFPIATFKNWVFISRYDDVVEVLRRQNVFMVPFGPKIEALNGGPNFLLGMKDGKSYEALHAVVAHAFLPSDNPKYVAPIAAEEAVALINESGGQLDAIRDLVTRVPTRVCERYYGVAIPEEVRFAHLAITMSTFMFGDPTDDPILREEALKAGDEVRPIIDAAIASARAAPPSDHTVTARLVHATDAKGKALPDKTIRAILIGMITGFVPTNTMGGGHMLEMLLRRPDMMRAAQAAARADDDELLKRCLWEAFRFLPLNPGPFRVCVEDAVIAANTRRAKKIAKGTKMLVGTHPAMFDPRRVKNPNRFDPGRPSGDNLTFGYGLHWCIGAPIAEAQITHTLKPLLLQRNLRRAEGASGQLALDGPFPAHLVVEFDPD